MSDFYWLPQAFYDTKSYVGYHDLLGKVMDVIKAADKLVSGDPEYHGLEKSLEALKAARPK
jgi:hypothetical protein